MEIPKNYIVVDSQTLNELEIRVSKFRNKCWETTGGIFALYDSERNNVIYYQALTKD